MFKKPKRNFRGRQKDSEFGEEKIKSNENVKEDIEEETPTIRLDELKKAKKKKKDKDKDKTEISTAILSFDHDEHDGDSEFKIKKSSHSKKIAKQLKKELLREKEEKERAEKLKNEVERSPPPPNRNYSADTLKAMIKAQNEMNGVVTMNSPEREEIKNDGTDKFKKTEPGLNFVKSGAIPDAATIHAIRKKRQQARETQDYIPINEDEKFDNEKSRLVREEDHDHSEDEGEEEPTRIALGVNKKDAQLRHMQQTLLQAREDDNSGSDHDWEEQQIRKGVHLSSSSTPSANGQQQQQHGAGRGGGGGRGRGVGRRGDCSSQVTDMEVEELGGRVAPPHGIPNTELPPVTMDIIISRIKSTLLEAAKVHRVHVHERDDLATRLDGTEADITDRCDGSSTKQRLACQYTFFQETRSYVHDLIECLNHKMPAIEHLEKSMFKQYQKYAEQFVKRRQQDIKDEAADALKMTKPGAVETPPAPDAVEKQRRIAERGARRARRKWRREAFQIREHEDGMSTDDELMPSEISSFKLEKERITTEGQRLFEDVVEDFHQLHPIMERFERWKNEHSTSYQEAYIGLCLPKLFSPLIRLRLIAWNPLEKDCRDFEETSWFESLIFYGHREGSEIVRHDSDLKLMPSIIEKVLLPKLTAFVEQVWDPLSTQQTVRLINLTKRLIADYPTTNADSKTTKMLVKGLMDRMRRTLDDDVFMPLYPKPILEANKTAASFFQRQFWQCVKLLDNVLKWHDIIADGPLQELALDGLLNRYIILALQNSPVDQTSVYACQVIISTFPDAWFQQQQQAAGSEEGEPIAGLQFLVRYCVCATTTLDSTALGKGEQKKKENRDRIKQLCKLLIQIHATNSAMQLAEKYSFKLGQL